MAYSKRAIVEEAFAEIGIAGSWFDQTPTEQLFALTRLDGMMAQWNSIGIRIAYNLPAGEGESDPDEMTGVTDEALEAIRTNLAVRIAPSFGKAVSPDTRATARSAYRALLARDSVPPEMQQAYPAPAGAGNKYRRFLPRPVDRLDAGPDSLLEFP